MIHESRQILGISSAECNSGYISSMLFLGLDLAWGRKNTSGACALRWNGTRGKVLDISEALGDDDAILAWIARWDAEFGAEGVLLGVDAPLLVPNDTGKRPCEAEIGRRFARFQAGAHPANRTIFGGDVRGERLVACLEKMGISHSPYLIRPGQSAVRQVMEVFPHPAHIVLFGLARTLKYKAKPGRDYPSRWAVFQEYGRRLRTLAAELSLELPGDWPAADAAGRIGSALKRYEDGLDALTCACIVLWYWRHGAAGAEVIGDMTEGYIVVPRRPEPVGRVQ